MSSQRPLVAIATLVLTIAFMPLVHAAGSSGGGGGGAISSAPTLSPEQRAERAFKSGIKHRDRALKQEAKAAAATSDKKRDKALAKAQKSFAKAIKKQGEAVQLNPQHYKAANELGFALRKTGDYRKAIGAYNYALELNPNFHEATEYRGEAFLALGRYEQTKASYMVLFRQNRGLADQLMSAFDQWITAQGQDLDEAQASFIAWVEERKRLAQVTQDLSMNNIRSW